MVMKCANDITREYISIFLSYKFYTFAHIFAEYNSSEDAALNKYSG